MLVPIIISLWFGYLANRCGKGVIEWALAGAFITFTLNTVLLNIAFALLPESMAENTDFGTFFVVRVIPAIITVLVMVVVGKKFLVNKIPQTPPAEDATAEILTEGENREKTA
jgi:hypothetical protein